MLFARIMSFALALVASMLFRTHGWDTQPSGPFALVHVNSGSRIAAQKDANWGAGFFTVDRGKIHDDQYWLLKLVNEQKIQWRKAGYKNCKFSGPKYTNLSHAKEACLAAGDACCGVRADACTCSGHGCFLCTHQCGDDASYARGGSCFYKKDDSEQYAIINANSGRSLHAHNGPKQRVVAVKVARQSAEGSEDRQKWTLLRQVDGSYLIRNVANGKLLMKQSSGSGLITVEDKSVKTASTAWWLMRGDGGTLKRPDNSKIAQCSLETNMSPTNAVDATVSSQRAEVKLLQNELLTAYALARKQEQRNAELLKSCTNAEFDKVLFQSGTSKNASDKEKSADGDVAALTNKVKALKAEILLANSMAQKKHRRNSDVFDELRELRFEVVSMRAEIGKLQTQGDAARIHPDFLLAPGAFSWCCILVLGIVYLLHPSKTSGNLLVRKQIRTNSTREHEPEPESGISGDGCCKSTCDLLDYSMVQQDTQPPLDCDSSGCSETETESPNCWQVVEEPAHR